ncbi:MAG: transcriptional initiation protein Tat [Gammaproteobacteria bacterium]|nr:transcriptional initiation protein Tat [Gammaproteobacteria bacterium]
MIQVSRRLFLGGAAAAIALPHLPTLASTTTKKKPRMLAYYVPNGIQMTGWTPSSEGAEWALTPILQPLADASANVDVKDDVLVISGLRNDPAKPDGPGDHAAGTGSFLTCAHVYKSESHIVNGISMDQVLANRIGGATRFASLQLGIEGGSSNGGCDSGYSCAYSRNISWAGPHTPLNKLTHPQGLFDLMFGGFDRTASAAERAERQAHKRSILDYVTGDAKHLQSRISAADKHKLDEYLTGLRSLEKSIAGQCGPGDSPPETFDYQQHVKIMTDLMVTAFRCDITRVATFMLNNAGSNRHYPFLGVEGAHHEISHHQDDPQKLADLRTIATWEVQQFAYLLQQMKNFTEEDGTTLLDNSMVFFSSEIEDGNSHRHENLPVLLAGGASGQLDTGRHIRRQDEPIANLFTAMLDLAGAPVSGFGDSTSSMDLT